MELALGAIELVDVIVIREQKYQYPRFWKIYGIYDSQ